jgi:hypothetical protein
MRSYKNSLAEIDLKREFRKYITIVQPWSSDAILAMCLTANETSSAEDC